jgi:aerobic carbon-monoxide dehydrogenase small subunit
MTVSTAPTTIRFTLNGAIVDALIAPHQSLVELLRERFDLFGARESCGQGLCGCCTVLVDGRAVSSCLYLAAFADGAEVITVEHLAADAGSTRCRRRSSRPALSSAVSAPPASC